MRTGYLASSLLQEAKEFMEKGEYEKMKKCYLMILDLRDTIGLELLVDFYINKNDTTNAIYYLQMLIDIKKNN